MEVAGNQRGEDRLVKLADLAHNSDVTRLDGEPTEKDMQRLEKYRKAISILEEAAGQSVESLPN